MPETGRCQALVRFGRYKQQICRRRFQRARLCPRRQVGDQDDPAARPPSRDWLAWIDVRGADFNRNTFGSDLKGTQVNAIAGLTRKFTPNFLVGVLGGYEHFDYSSQAFNGLLKGDGWTAGTYLGWRLTPNLRIDAGGAWSNILVNDAAGMAAGNFIGHRWLVTGGLTGTYVWRAVLVEPSAQTLALWEHENAYTDSLGTLQTERNFATGRASSGVKVSYPLAWSERDDCCALPGPLRRLTISQGTMRSPTASPPCRSCKDGPGA